VSTTTDWDSMVDIAVGSSDFGRRLRSVSLLVHTHTLHDVSAGHGRTGTYPVKSELGVDTNVVVGKLAEVGIIDTDNLGLLAGSKS